MGKVWDEMQSARIEDLTHSIEPTPEREQATYESASITITAGSREDLFTIGRAKLNKLFGKGCYRITEVSYTMHGNLVIGEMYAIYLGKDV